MERLESLGVPVIGYKTNELPGFFTVETGILLDARADSVGEIVSAWRTHLALGRRQAFVVVQPPPADSALEAAAVTAAVREARADAQREGVRGAAVTPYLLAAVTRLTHGSSLAANLALLEQNAALAAEVATMCSRVKSS
jgi:pseudouridine-5'-phosphate glycosidase